MPMFQPPVGLPPLVHHQGALPQAQGNSLDKLAEVMEKDMKRKEKRDTELKNKRWTKLAEVERSTILLASMQQDFVKPDAPSDFMKKMLESETGIQARGWLHTYLDENTIDVDKGMYTAIARGYLVSQPSERDINGFSIAFCGADFQLRKNDENNDLLVEEQTAHGKMSQEILKMLTTPTLPLFTSAPNQSSH